MAAALPEILDNECFCPVCLEEFYEPKSLPNCAHNVCKPCLQNMVSGGEVSISCPTCRTESKLPSGGVDFLPTNRLILKLLDATPGRREKAEIRRLLDECHAKVSCMQKSAESREIRKRAVQHGLKLKENIMAASLKLTEAICLKETELCKEVDRLFGIVGDESSEGEGLETYWSEWLQVSREFIDGAEDVLQKESLSDIQRRRTHLVSLGNDILNTECELSDHTEDVSVLSVTFAPNRGIFHQVEDTGFGKLVPGDDTDSPQYETEGDENDAEPLNADGSNVQLHATDSSNVPSIHHSLSRSLSTQSASIDITVSAGDIGLDSLSPLSISSGSQGDIALADPTKKRILLLNSEGRHKKTLRSGCSGLTFVQSGEMLAVCHPKEVQFLNPQDGNLCGTFPNVESSFRYRTISCDGRDKLIITCEASSLLHKPCICIYRIGSNGQLEIKCRFSVTGSPFKTVYHDNQYFVSNTSKGCIMVYDELGHFVRQFGKRKHGNGALTSPMGLALYPWNNSLLVCDSNTQSIQMYETSGRFIDKFALGGSPSDVTVLQDGTIVVCSQSHHWGTEMRPNGKPRPTVLKLKDFGRTHSD